MQPIAHRIVIAFALGSTLFGSGMRANDAPELPLEQKVHQADLVGIGTVIAVDVASSKRIGLEHIATIRIDTLLKGGAVKSIELIYDTGMYETDPLCCIQGATYLFFLRRNSRGLFTSVNGPRGVYQIDVQKAWPYGTMKP